MGLRKTILYDSFACIQNSVRRNAGAGGFGEGAGGEFRLAPTDQKVFRARYPSYQASKWTLKCRQRLPHHSQRLYTKAPLTDNTESTTPCKGNFLRRTF